MPRLSEASRLKRRDDIAAAAMRCFARDGFASTSMADIIKEAGSSAGSVYSNFESKADLMRYAATSALRPLVASVLRELPSDRTPASVLTHLLEASSDLGHAQIVLQIWAEIPRDPEMTSLGHSSVLELRELIQGALLPWAAETGRRDTETPQAVAGSMADIVLTLLQGYLVRISIDPDADAAHLSGVIVSVLADR